MTAEAKGNGNMTYLPTPRTMPQSVEAEAALLGDIFLGGQDTLDEVRGLGVVVESFFQRKHQHVFQAMLDVADSMREPDPTAVTDRLKAMGRLEQVGGFDYVCKLAVSSATRALAGQHAALVLEKARARRLIEICIATAEAAYSSPDIDQGITDASGAILALSEGHSEENQVGAAHRGVCERMDRIEKGERVGLPMTIKSLNEYLGGWLPLYMSFNAEGGFGKSAMIEQEILPLIEAHHPVTLCEFDMSEEETMLRLACRKARVPFFLAQRGYLRHEQREAVKQASDGIDRLSNYFRLVSHPMTGRDFRMMVRRHSKRYGTKLFFVDGFRGLSIPRGENVVEGLMQNSLEIKFAVRESKVGVVVLNHIPFDSKMDRDDGPSTANAKWCNQVYDDCHTFAVLWRVTDLDRETRQCRVGCRFFKNRGGPPGKRTLLFHGPSMTFLDDPRGEPDSKQEELPI